MTCMSWGSSVCVMGVCETQVRTNKKKSSKTMRCRQDAEMHEKKNAKKWKDVNQRIFKLRVGILYHKENFQNV